LGKGKIDQPSQIKRNERNLSDKTEAGKKKRPRVFIPEGVHGSGDPINLKALRRKKENEGLIGERHGGTE